MAGRGGIGPGEARRGGVGPHGTAAGRSGAPKHDLTLSFFQIAKAATLDDPSEARTK